MPDRLIRILGSRAHSNHAEVSRALGVDIVGGQIALNARLPSDSELEARFGISRPVLREGVKTLAAKGLLSSKARVGTVVRDRSAWNMFDPDVLAWHLEVGVDTQFLRDLADVRLAVEPKASALAAIRRTPDDLVAMRDALARMEADVRGGFTDGDCALHLAVAAASANPFMRSIEALVEAALRASFSVSAPHGPAQRAEVLHAHKAVIDAIEAHDADAAANAMIEVIEGGLRQIDDIDDAVVGIVM